LLEDTTLAEETNILELEKSLATFYCTKFVKVFGRPPVIPHSFEAEIPVKNEYGTVTGWKLVAGWQT